MGNGTQCPSGWAGHCQEHGERKEAHSGRHASRARCGGGDSQKFSSGCLYCLSQRGSKFTEEGDEKGLGGLAREGDGADVLKRRNVNRRGVLSIISGQP